MPINPTPSTPNISNSILSSFMEVKSATPDIVLINEEDTPIEQIVDLVFENIGGQELINIARNDTVNGQQLYYNPIKNLSSIQQQYNPKNIISLQQTSDKYFQNFAIKSENNLPIISGGPNNFNVYLEDATGNIIIEVINLQEDERVEVQVAVDGTIYEAEL
jgi:hypothetical protein